MKKILGLTLVISAFFNFKTFADEYICENIKFADGSSASPFFLNLKGNKATTKNKYFTIDWTEVPVGYDYKIFKMTTNTSQGLMIVAVQEDDKRILNYTSVSGQTHHVRNLVSLGNCSKLGG